MNEAASSIPPMSNSSASVATPVSTLPVSTVSMLSMTKITKRFPGVVANSGVSFDVCAGEVHALLGENGAGKTTLMNILYGLYQPDEGEIRLRGEGVRFRSPKDAMNKGIGLVAQHFHLARRHTVAENIGLGLRGVPFFFPTRKLEQTIRDLGQKYRLAVDPNALVWQLSPGEQQRVEILKALIQGAQILILDEPTSVLTPQEAEGLFEVVSRMRDAGEAIIFISHKLDEVMAIADRITVLRKGAVVGTLNKSEASPNKLAQMMVGRDMPRVERKEVKSSGQSVLKLSGVWAKSQRGSDALRGLDLELKQGEIVGVAGVAGNGQAELIEVLTGLCKVVRGSITLAGTNVTSLNAKGLFEAGVAHIPEDRNHMGVVPSMSVSENMVLRQYRYQPFTKAGLLDWNAVKNFAEASIKDYEIATPSKDTVTRLLSGGNVQKVILARELSGQPKLVVAAHPTYGLDVSATALTHELLLKQREHGSAVLLVSEDLDELFKLSDRIAVMFAGQVVGVVDTLSASREEVGLMMAGSKVA
jgi:general nucleoside transport system ATP-binding protein